jgi:hypothetical protein
MDTRSKILTARSALEAARRVKQEGRKVRMVTVILTSGGWLIKAVMNPVLTPFSNAIHIA